MADDGGGLFNISLFDSEEDSSTASGAATASGDANSATQGNSKDGKRDKNFQSEAEFQAVKSQYRPKIENGEVSDTDNLHPERESPCSRHGSPLGFQIWSTVKLPLGDSVSKPEAQTLIHAVEELYFFGRYDEAAAFIHRILDGTRPAAGLDDDTKDLLRLYEDKCRKKAAK